MTQKSKKKKEQDNYDQLYQEENQKNKNTHKISKRRIDSFKTLTHLENEYERLHKLDNFFTTKDNLNKEIGPTIQQIEQEEKELSHIKSQLVARLLQKDSPFFIAMSNLYNPVFSKDKNI